MKAFIVDEGVLLTRDNPEFARYAVVYDKNYGYYDENQYDPFGRVGHTRT